MAWYFFPIDRRNKLAYNENDVGAGPRPLLHIEWLFVVTLLSQAGTSSPEGVSAR